MEEREVGASSGWRMLFVIAIVLAAAAPATQAIDMQSRTALANCMAEAALSIAATVTTHKGVCEAGEWDIRVVVPEWVGQKIPIQGSVFVSGEDGSGYELNGKMAAVFNPLLNDVSCRVDTVDRDGVFAGGIVTGASRPPDQLPLACCHHSRPRQATG